MWTENFKKLIFLLLPPLLMICFGLIALAVFAHSPFTPMSVILLTFLMTVAMLTNAIPFTILFFVHRWRLRQKGHITVYSFWVAYVLGLVSMLIIIPLALREIILGTQGSQFIGLVFIYMPNIIVQVMVVSYGIGWIIERFI